MMSKCMGEKQERKRGGMAYALWKGQKRRNKDGETRTDAGGLLASWSHGESDWRRLTVEVCLPPEAMVKSRPGCCQGPCWVSSWPYSSQGPMIY